jgi:hypothetical protein
MHTCLWRICGDVANLKTCAIFRLQLAVRGARSCGASSRLFFSLGSSFKTVDEACTRGRARSLVGGLAASDADRFATIFFSFPFEFLAGRELWKRTGTIDVVS